MSRSGEAVKAADLRRYPTLFAEAYWPWGPMYARFHRLADFPPRAQVANVNVVPRIGGRWVIISMDGEAWDLPGGTLEAGETVIAAARRELMEEVGAELLSDQVIGAWRWQSLAEKPYRPPMPHPEFLRLVLVGEVGLTARSTNPPDREQIEAVDLVEFDEALRRFVAYGRGELAELYTLAAEVQTCTPDV